MNSQIILYLYLLRMSLKFLTMLNKLLPYPYQDLKIKPFFVGSWFKHLAIILLIIRPNPTPYLLYFLFSMLSPFPNALKSNAWSDSRIPIPVSFTVMIIIFSKLSYETIIQIAPSKVNLEAFPNKLMRIYFILPLS